MSDTTRFIKQRAQYWYPVINRGALWAGIAMLTDFRHSIAEFVKKIAAGGTITGYEKLDAGAGMLLAGAIAIRIFLDQSVSRHQAEHTKAANSGDTKQLTTLG